MSPGAPRPGPTPLRGLLDSLVDDLAAAADRASPRRAMRLLDGGPEHLAGRWTRLTDPAATVLLFRCGPSAPGWAHRYRRTSALRFSYTGEVRTDAPD